MSTFAVTNSGEVIDGLNYVLSNLNLGNVSGNITVPDGTLVANATTGEITQYNSGGTVYGYVNQYVNLRYATNSTGTAGFSTVPTNATYFGVYNSATPTPSANPAAYVWREVAGGFGLTKTIYYSAIGGRQVLWAAASSPPSSNYVISTANVAIDLDVVTTAAGTPGQRGPIAMAYVVTTADPNTATSAQLTAWFEAARDAVSPPIGTGLTPPVAGDTATFIYGAGVGTPSGTFEYNGSVWVTVTPQVISGNVIVANSLPATTIVPASITGDRVAANTITGNLIAANTITGSRIQAATITGNLIAANTITGNTIQVGTLTGNLIAANTITGNRIQVGTLTGNLIAANTITGNTIQVGTLTGNLIAANTITGNLIAANTIQSNSIVANSITATQISSSYIYAGNIVSISANIGNVSSTGYWLEYQSGNARFGGNVSIGANLSVQGLITAGDLDANTVNTGQMVTNSATTVLFQASPSGNAFNTVNYYNTTGNVYWPFNTRAFAVPAVAIRPTTSGSQNGSSILVSFTAGVAAGNILSPTAPDYNLVELWRNGPSLTYGNTFSSIQLAVANNSSVTSNELMTIGGSNGVIGISTTGGDSWGFNTSGTLDIVDVPTIQVSNAGNSVVDVASYGLLTSINNHGGTSGSWTFDLGGKLTSGRVLFTGQEVGNVNIDNDIGIITGYTAFAKMFRPFNFATPGPYTTDIQLDTPVGVFSDIYSMDWGYATTGNNLVKNAVFSCTGGDILTTQFQYYTGNSQVSYSTVARVSAPTDSDLYSVSCDRGTSAPTAFVAVGEAGAIQRSTNNGSSWTAIASPTANVLRGVVGTGLDATKRFVAVGDSGTILMSQDGGVTWSAATVPTPSDGNIRNLYAVSFCPTGGTGNAGLWTAVGQGIIYNCDKTSTTWSIEYEEAAVTSNTMNRLVYLGSNFDVMDNTLTANVQTIGNTVVTFNYQDTDYTNSNTYQYYLVVGNMLGNTGAILNVTAKYPSLTVQEIKR
jgi:hypothetical protein